MDFIKSEKVYIDKIEAIEISMERGNFYNLPRKGQEVLTVGSKLKPVEILGKDDLGFYLQAMDRSMTPKKGDI